MVLKVFERNTKRVQRLNWWADQTNFASFAGPVDVWSGLKIAWFGWELNSKKACFSEQNISEYANISVVHCLNYSVYIVCLVLFCHLASIIFCPRGFIVLCLQLPEFEVLCACTKKEIFCISSLTPLCFALFWLLRINWWPSLLCHVLTICMRTKNYPTVNLSGFELRQKIMFLNGLQLWQTDRLWCKVIIYVSFSSFASGLLEKWRC